jgi:hypothetical protein
MKRLLKNKTTAQLMLGIGVQDSETEDTAPQEEKLGDSNAPAGLLEGFEDT